MDGTAHGSAAEASLVPEVELSERRTVRQEAAQTRTGSAQPVLISDERKQSIVITEGASSSSNTGNVDEWLISIMADKGENGTSQSKKTLIQKVPPMLREIEANKTCYDPLVVAIGPYHHGNHRLQLMEKLKTTTARQFVSNSKMDITVFYKRFAKVAEDARNCYAEGSTENFDDISFTKMMFLDGCFILHFIDCMANEKVDDINMHMRNHYIPFVLQDLFLLENQIPYLVLTKLMSLSYEGKIENKKKEEDAGNKKEEDKGAWKANMEKFFAKQINACMTVSVSSAWGLFQGLCMTGRDNGRNDQILDDSLHLLDILRTRLVRNSQDRKHQGILHCLISLLSKLPQWILHNLKSLLCNSQGKNDTEDWQSFRSVKELNTAGIVCIRSHTNCLKDVEFKSSFYGKLYLPPIVIDYSTKSKFLNLIAYEMCPDGPVDHTISSYICFMDALIDRAEDVKELRSKRILLNCIGSDEQVADLFNQISTNLVPNEQDYKIVKRKIEQHYKNSCRVWLAEFYNTHFRTPWAAIAFLAALLVIGLTITQTYYTIHPPKK